MLRAGFGVILVDAQTFPRDKVCGDFVSPVALRELRELGIAELANSRRSHTIRTAALHLDGEHLITSAIPRVAGLPAYGRVIPRKLLDEWIVAKARDAGAQVWEGSRIKGFEVCRDHIQVSVQHTRGLQNVRAKVLIGADGSSSLIARTMRGQNLPDNDRIIAVRGYFEGIDGPADRADIFFSSSSFPGYAWLFPISKTGANVGVGMVLKTVPPSHEHLRRLLFQLVHDDVVLRNRLRQAQLVGPVTGWPLATYDPTLPISSHRILLVGDAAGLINPLNGEGIQYALLSAAWAADAVKRCAARGDFSQAALATYTRRVTEELRYDMALSRTIVQFIRNRSLNPVWLAALRIIAARAAHDPEYAALTGGVLAGLVPVRRVTSLNVIHKTLEQAALSLGLRAVNAALLGPNRLAHLGVAVTRAAVDMATSMVQNRAESITWGLDLANNALELKGEISDRVSRGRKSSTRAARSRKVPRVVAHS